MHHGFALTLTGTSVAFNLKDAVSGLFAVLFFAKSNKIKPNLIKFSLILLI